MTGSTREAGAGALREAVCAEPERLKSHKVIYDKVLYVLVVPRHSDPFLHALNPKNYFKNLF